MHNVAAFIILRVMVDVFKKDRNDSENGEVVVLSDDNFFIYCEKNLFELGWYYNSKMFSI